MKKRFTRFLSLGLVGAMAISMTACGSASTKSATGASASTDATAGSSTGAAASSDTPLVIGEDAFSQKFSPFFATTVPDVHIGTLVCPLIYGVDRQGQIVNKGIEGETRSYNGTDYTYYGLSDVTMTKDDAKNETVYDIKLRDDAKFSDGEPLTADDLIFTLYVLADNDYDGAASIYSLPIKGMKNYRANSTVADSITDDDIAKALKDMPDDLAAKINSDVITPLLQSESQFCKDNLDSYKDQLKVSTAEEMFAALYAVPMDAKYSAKGKDFDTIIADTAKLYGSDYKTLATNYGDASYLDQGANTAAQAYLVEKKRAAGEGEEVPNIEGIKKVGDHEVTITTDGYDATVIYSLAVQIGALHYYGDKSQYDYANNKFGFKRGDLSAIREKTTTPLGYGPYVFNKYENKTVYMTANDSYYAGAPKVKNLQLKETQEADKIPGVQQGTIDLSEPSGSKDAFDQIKGINSNGELTGDKLGTDAVDFLGYGYIGINADIIRVGDKSDSEASKDLRKALATMISVYRDVNINTYFGDAATVINYPISSVSWASPQKSDDGYQVAYSTDVDGNPIYTDGMSADDKYAAAKKAALGYFEAAGYTVSGGKITAAPKNAPMEAEVMIGGGGNGDHPSYGILTDAKAALAELGFTLTINDLADSSTMWDVLDANTNELWCAAWQATPDPDMYQVYHSSNRVGKGGTNSNHYNLADSDLDEMIMEARTSDDQEYRKQLYKQCLDTILDWAVEIPVYQRQECTVYSTERVNSDSMPKDQTSYYGWRDEIQNVTMK